MQVKAINKSDEEYLGCSLASDNIMNLLILAITPIRQKIGLPRVEGCEDQDWGERALWW